jgi:hypothetical protein
MRCSEASPWISTSPRQVNRAGKLPVDTDELGMLQPGRRRSPPLDHLRLLRRALQLRGELLNLPVLFPRSPAFGIIAAPSITVSRRTAMSPVRLRRPNQSGATTILLALIR